jgi:hypothetical protein
VPAVASFVPLLFAFGQRQAGGMPADSIAAQSVARKKGQAVDQGYPYSTPTSSGPVRRPSRAVRLVLLGAVLIGLIVLYVLSVGPVTWLDNRGFVPPSAGTFFVYFYAPLFAAGRCLPAIEHLLDWYISFFE